MDPLLVCRVIAQVFWLVLGVGLSLAGLTWQLWRMTRYLKEALAREQRSSTAREKKLIDECLRIANSRQQSLLEKFLREPTPTLRDLVEFTDREFRARASAAHSAESDETMELSTRHFIPR